LTKSSFVVYHIIQRTCRADPPPASWLFHRFAGEAGSGRNFDGDSYRPHRLQAAAWLAEPVHRRYSEWHYPTMTTMPIKPEELPR
jgi:hypothetical protein